jgi:glucose-1-phosphate thymidylyltransferase
MYLTEGMLTHSILEGWWTDAGTFELLLLTTNFVAQTGANKVPGRGVPPTYGRIPA